MTSTPPYSDHFSDRAPGYAVYRPRYPREIVDYMADLAVGPGISGGTVWEAGCGSGQLTQVLVERFTKIIATDASEKQLAHAKPLSNVQYRVAPAEASGLPGASVDLAVAAQAAHWFDLDRYYAEVRRVLRPGGIIALVVYGIHVTQDAKVDAIIRQFYYETLSGYWPPERKLVEEQYRPLPFPFGEFQAPRFEMKAQWTFEEMVGYIQTWSAVTRMTKSSGAQALDMFKQSLARAWGPPSARHTIRWPLATRTGRST